jgi:hypothetical protein
MVKCAKCRFPDEGVSAGPTCSVDQLRVWRLQYGQGAELEYRHSEPPVDAGSSQQDCLLNDERKH